MPGCPPGMGASSSSLAMACMVDRTATMHGAHSILHGEVIEFMELMHCWLVPVYIFFSFMRIIGDASAGRSSP
jgi:hypothetical protein